MAIETRQQIGIKLRALRKEQRLTQEKLSQETGIDRAYLSRIESGCVNYTFDQFEKILEALGVSVWTFFNK